MLFQSFYNWIRYKSSPPSFFFKNRLFLERDGQSSRIFSQFGQTFRSSKWNMVSNFGTKFHFKRYVFVFIVFLGFFFLYFSNTILFIFNILSFLFWFSTDLFDYYFSFIIWFLFFFFSFCGNHLYLYLFYNNFSAKKNHIDLLKMKFSAPIALVPNNTTNTKINLNWALYTWINQSEASEPLRILVEKLFINNNINNTSLFWQFNHNFFNKLYKILLFKSLSEIDVYAQKKYASILLNSKINNFNNLPDNTLNNEFITLYLWYYVNLNKSYFNDNCQKTYKNMSYSNLTPSVLSFTNVSNNFFLQNRFGLFTNFNVNFNQINNFSNSSLLSQIAQDSLNNSILSGKINRWLSRYFVLNRKLFKNSHKWVQLKTALTSSFISSSHFNRNLWNAHFFKNQENFKALISWNYFTNNLQQPNSSWNYLKTSQFGFEQNSINFSKFMFIENSYFWLVKRFFFTNNLSSNLFFSEIIPKKNKNNTFRNNSLSDLNSNLTLNPLFDLTLTIDEIFFKNKILHQFSASLALYSTSSPRVLPLARDLHLIFNYNENLNLTDLKILNLINNFETNNYSLFYLNNAILQITTPTLIKKNFFKATVLSPQTKKFKQALFLQLDKTLYKTTLKNFLIILHKKI